MTIPKRTVRLGQSANCPPCPAIFLKSDPSADQSRDLEPRDGYPYLTFLVRAVGQRIKCRDSKLEGGCPLPGGPCKSSRAEDRMPRLKTPR